MHLYCLGYVYDFTLRPELLAPALWTLLWIIAIRVATVIPDLDAVWKGALWIFPSLATLLATPQSGKEVFLVLTVLNAAIYGWIYYRERTRLALHLILISLVALLAGLPEDWGRSLATEFSRQRFVGGAAAIYVLVCLALSSSPKLGIFGALIAALSVGAVRHQTDTVHWSLQVGLVFLLLHSLRWTDSKEEGTKAIRWIAGLTWIAHSIIWTHAYGAGWRVYTIALPVLAVYLAFRWLQGRWGPLPVALASVVVLIAAPIQMATTQLQSAPGGVLAVIGSFVLFGLGTLAAITKPRWAHPGEHHQASAHDSKPVL